MISPLEAKSAPLYRVKMEVGVITNSDRGKKMEVRNRVHLLLAFYNRMKLIYKPM